MSHTWTGFCVFVLASLYLVCLSTIGVSSTVPPLHREYEQSLREICRFYNENERVPAPEELSPRTRQLIARNEGVTYSTAEGISYRYPRAYPANVSIVGVLTCGLWCGGERKCIGRGCPPESIAHIAALRNRDD